MCQPQQCDESELEPDLEEIQRKVRDGERLTDSEAAVLAGYMIDRMQDQNTGLRAELQRAKQAMAEFCRVIAYIAVASAGQEPAPGAPFRLTMTKQEWQNFYKRFDAKVDIGADSVSGDRVVQITLIPKVNAPQILEATPAQQQAVAQRKLVIP